MNEPNKAITPQQTTTLYPTLQMREGQFLFSFVNQAGGLIERFVSPAAVREAFSQVPVDSGWCNHTATSPVVCRWGDGRHGEWGVLYVPPGKHRLEITNDGSGQPYDVEHVDAPLPGLAFIGVGTNYYVFAMKTKHLDVHQEIYRCPLPNVMQDGSVCWGLLKQPQATARSLHEAWRLFVGSTFNNHAAAGKSKRCREDVRIVLKEAAQAPDDAHYPVGDLVRQYEPAGMTLDRAVREFFETGEMPG